MKLVSYIYKKIIPMFLGSLLFFAVVINLVDLFINITNYLQNGCAASDIVKVMIYYIPKTIWYGVPVAILFATSYSLSDMYAHNELEALFASGVSLFKFTSPILLLSILLSFCLFVFENKVVVSTYEKKVTLQNQLLGIDEDENNWDVIVLSDNGKVVYKAERYIEETKELDNCYFIFRNDNKDLECIINADMALWSEEEQKWLLEEARQYIPDGNRLDLVPVTDEYTSRLTESYEIFRNSNIDVQYVNSKDAKVYIEHLKKAGLPYKEELSEYYKKFSFPFIVFIVVFLSIGLTGKTKKNVLLVSLALCICASVLFYVTMMITMIFAKHGYISPFMGAWFPVILFTIISFILLKYSKT